MIKAIEKPRCRECIHKKGTRCEERSMQINQIFINVYGCDNYKCRYESLLEE